jgi:hypothetical protein
MVDTGNRAQFLNALGYLVVLATSEYWADISKMSGGRVILEKGPYLVIDWRISPQSWFALMMPNWLVVNGLQVDLRLRINDSLAFGQVFNGTNLGQRLIEGSSRAQIFFALVFQDFCFLKFSFCHVLKCSSQRALSLIGYDIVSVVGARSWIGFVKRGNISNSFDRIGCHELTILKHRAWPERHFAPIPTLLLVVVLKIVRSWTWSVWFCTHKVLVNEPGFCVSILIVLHQ